MKSVLVRILLKAACTFLTILIIIMGLQFLIRTQPGQVIDLMVAESSMSSATTGTDTVRYQLGLDRPWRPDLWPFNDTSLWSGGSSMSNNPSTSSYSSTAPASSTAQGKVGLSTGGSKDVNNFRDNIKNNYLPLPTSITYEGLYYDYYFDTGVKESCNKLFCPSYSYAVTRDPISHQTEYYLSVGLNSGLREEDFQRKKLNLVVVLDISDSMNACFDQYYYDGYGKQIDAYGGEGINRLKKIDSAKQAVVSILDQLRPDDRFAIVLFDSNATLARPMGLVRRTDMWDVKDYILDIATGGTTNLASGMDMATAQFRGLSEVDSYEYENRIIVLTDAQPNTGDFTVFGLSETVQRNASNRVYTTFIGIGVDFNNELIELITKTKGANYYSVHSPREFRERMEQEFDYMVTPLVFNVQMNFESSGWRIQQVFGSPEADASTGHLMRISTLFPSRSKGGETKGGLVLVKLQKKSSMFGSDQIYLRVTYEDRNGIQDSSQAVISLEQTLPEYFANTGIRKGILLTRYAALLKNWMIDKRGHWQYSRPWNPCVREDTGIILPVENTNQWEQQSLPLTVSQPYRQLFSDFSRYFNSEMNAIGDCSLDQELAILNTLARR